VKRETEEAPLTAARYARSNIEECRWQQARAVEDHDLSALERHEKTRIAGVGDRRGLGEAGQDRLERDLRRGLSGTAAREHEQSEGQTERELS
jgi:hypothetical protein